MVLLISDVTRRRRWLRQFTCRVFFFRADYPSASNSFVSPSCSVRADKKPSDYSEHVHWRPVDAVTSAPQENRRDEHSKDSASDNSGDYFFLDDIRRTVRHFYNTLHICCNHDDFFINFLSFFQGETADLSSIIDVCITEVRNSWIYGSTAVSNIMAYDPRNIKYSPNTHTRPNMTSYAYSSHPSQHFQQTDENRNENNLCSTKEVCSQISQQSSSTQTVQKVDAATMTDPLQIDFRLTSEYLARCSSTLGLPYVTKYEDNSNNSTHNCQEIRPKIEFEIEPQHINGKLLHVSLTLWGLRSIFLCARRNLKICFILYIFERLLITISMPR